MTFKSHKHIFNNNALYSKQQGNHILVICSPSMIYYGIHVCPSLKFSLPVGDGRKWRHHQEWSTDTIFDYLAEEGDTLNGLS